MFCTMTLCGTHRPDARRPLLILCRVAPECITSHKYSEKSDVWSFGVLMWEIWTNAAEPYGGWTNEQVLTILSGAQVCDASHHFFFFLLIQVVFTIIFCRRLSPTSLPLIGRCGSK